MSPNIAQPRQASGNQWPRGGEGALQAYAGKWIALDGQGEVRGSGDTAEEAQKAAHRAGVDQPLFFFVVEGA